MVDLPHAHYAYVAGFLDGEGCFSVHPREGRMVTGVGKLSTPRSLQLRVEVSQGNEPVIRWMGELFGFGRTYKTKTTMNRPHWRFVVTTAPDILRFIELVRPYVKVKRRQMELMESACRFTLARFRQYWTDEQFQHAISEFYLPMCELNASSGTKGKWAFNPGRLRGPDGRAMNLLGNHDRNPQQAVAEAREGKPARVRQAPRNASPDEFRRLVAAKLADQQSYQ